MKAILFTLAAAAFLLVAFVQNQAPETNSEVVWVTDYAAAVKQAKKENKRLLLNFTGSDWCGWCKRLNSEVFSQAEFVEYANKNLVCVKLDFPKKTKLPKAETEQNNKLLQQYNVEGFPTILILDKTEKLLGKTGYRQGGATAYTTHLEQFK